MSEPIMLTLTISDAHHERLDKALSQLIPKEYSISRSRLKELILNGHVFRNDQVIKNAKQSVQPGETYRLRIPAPVETDIQPQNIPLDIVYEDTHLLVIDKPAGMVVHPARGAPKDTLVNALLFHCAGELSGIGGVTRPGIVHRIDKDTSGLLVIAKDDRSHEGLGRQFRAHSVHRRYRAFCYGVPSISEPKIMSLPGVSARGAELCIDLPIGRHNTDRLKMAVQKEGKNATTFVKNLTSDATQSISEVECRLLTGRTHQIRVHLTHIGHPLLGDPIYGKGARHLKNDTHDTLRQHVTHLSGQALHAAELGFEHPITGKWQEFSSPLRAELAQLEKSIALA